MGENGNCSAFDEMMATVESPVYLVTVTANGEKAGCLVGFATQMSIDPLRFVVGLSRTNETYRVAEAARYLAVHVVGVEHLDLVQLFGGETGDEIDKFERCVWSEGPFGQPILRDAGIWFVGEVLERLDVGGDHSCYVLEPLEGGSAGDGAAERGAWIAASQVQDLHPGHEA
ncbi:flavin reductase family protein [Gordonia sp. (in: high G+C Gram-positive bacteria)]|uniref:flavin reductase family protein n=1 Tax=Gordonia sp. (in: high G+C Gram-positive bacteria) TaxID=84139 RepID=UPI003C77A5BB